MTTYELTVTPDYVADWGVWEGVREILQNAIDAKLDGKPFDVFWGDDSITVQQVGVSLSANTLLLGSSTKKDKRYLGQFGEGYKMAFLALIRAGVTVEVEQMGKTWTAAFRYLEKYDSKVLVIEEAPNGIEEEVLIWKLSGISERDMRIVDARYLSDATPRVMKETNGSQIFVGGLFVAEFPGIQYGYNFAPGEIMLNRDRNMSLSYSILVAMAKLIPDFFTPKEILGHCITGTQDFQHITSDYAKAEMLAKTWHEIYPNHVPVSDERQIKELKPGVAYKVVNYSLASTIRSVIDLAKYVCGIKTPREKLVAFKNKVQSKLSHDELIELIHIIEELE